MNIHSLSFFIKNCYFLFPGAGERAQWLEEHPVLAEDLGLVSSIHMVAYHHP